MLDDGLLLGHAFQIALVEDALAGPGDIDDAESLLGRHYDILALQHDLAVARLLGFLAEKAAIARYGKVTGLNRRAAISGNGRADQPSILLEGIEQGIVFHLRWRHITAATLRGGDGGLYGRNLRRSRHIEIYAGSEGVAAECLAHRSLYDVENDLFVLELDLRLGRVDVDVHLLRRGLQIDEIGWQISLGDEFLVGQADRLVEVGRAEVAAIDEEILAARRLAGILGRTDPAPDGNNRSVGLHRHQLANHLPSEKVADAQGKVGGGAQVIDILSVGNQPHSHFRTGQGHAQEFVYDMFQFGIVALEKLAAGRHVVEEVADLEIGALGRRYGRLLHKPGCRHTHQSARFILLPAGFQRHLGHGRNRGESLSAEAEGRNALQILRFGDLGGSVALEAEQSLVSGHSASVVYHLNKGAAGIENHHRDAFGPGIDGILDQFLDNGGGAGNHLARRDKVGYILGKYLEHLLEQLYQSL